jgi:MFS family permease
MITPEGTLPWVGSMAMLDDNSPELPITLPQRRGYSAGLNITCAIGSALAGNIIAASGLAAPFWMNAIATIGVIAALLWWRPRAEGLSRHFQLTTQSGCDAEDNAIRIITAYGAELAGTRARKHQ